MQPADRAGLVDVNAARRLPLARKGELLFEPILEPQRADGIDAEPDGGEACRIVELVMDQPAVGQAVLRPGKLVRQDRHEGIGEQVADAGFLQRRDRGGRVGGAAYVVAVVDDGRRAVGQHLEAADVGRIEIVLGGVAAAQRQELGVIGAWPQVGHVAAQHRLPQAGVGIDDAGQRDHAGAVDPLGVGRVERRPDGAQDAILDQDVGRGEIAQGLVHRDDLSAADMNSLGHTVLARFAEVRFRSLSQRAGRTLWFRDRRKRDAQGLDRGRVERSLESHGFSPASPTRSSRSSPRASPARAPAPPSFTPMPTSMAAGRPSTGRSMPASSRAFAPRSTFRSILPTRRSAKAASMTLPPRALPTSKRLPIAACSNSP